MTYKIITPSETKTRNKYYAQIDDTRYQTVLVYQSGYGFSPIARVMLRTHAEPEVQFFSTMVLTIAELLIFTSFIVSLRLQPEDDKA